MNRKKKDFIRALILLKIAPFIINETGSKIKEQQQKQEIKKLKML